MSNGYLNSESPWEDVNTGREWNRRFAGHVPVSHRQLYEAMNIFCRCDQKARELTGEERTKLLEDGAREIEELLDFNPLDANWYVKGKHHPLSDGLFLPILMIIDSFRESYGYEVTTTLDSWSRDFALADYLHLLKRVDELEERLEKNL